LSYGEAEIHGFAGIGKVVGHLRRALSFSAILLIAILLTGCPTVPPPAPTKHVPRTGAAVNGTPYTIQSGDTLFSIAQKHGIDWGDLLEANPSLNPRDLPVGATITILGGAGTSPTPGATTPEREKPEMNPGHPGPIPAESRLEWPLKGEILSRFGAPVSWREGTPNYGLDIRGTSGEIVSAAKSGKVNTFTNIPLLGKVVILEHTDGSSSLYGHLDEVLVTHGTWVRQGERIGVVGSSGRSKGTELHFRLWMGNRFVDPAPYLPR